MITQIHGGGWQLVSVVNNADSFAVPYSGSGLFGSQECRSLAQGIFTAFEPYPEDLSYQSVSCLGRLADEQVNFFGVVSSCALCIYTVLCRCPLLAVVSCFFWN